MDNDTTKLLDLDGLAVERVERLADGTRRVHLVTADETARACPACGTFALRVKGLVRTRPRDLPYGERRLELVWLKRRWYCHEPDCARRSFTEQVPQIPAGTRITTRLRQAAALRVHNAGSTVVQAARDLCISWPTVMSAFRTAAGEVTEAELPEVEVGGPAVQVRSLRHSRTPHNMTPTELPRRASFPPLVGRDPSIRSIRQVTASRAKSQFQGTLRDISS
ncbi:helix-turn-helix domain-containing protein [Streptomyces sp. CA-106131]|uniref:helix-turn-helix domain-containing protein n=1 Tax=Streptomyces sp. CA-106131 TaxID=3240045 RepID=UPI003D8ACB67